MLQSSVSVARVETIHRRCMPVKTKSTVCKLNQSSVIMYICLPDDLTARIMTGSAARPAHPQPTRRPGVPNARVCAVSVLLSSSFFLKKN